MFQYVRNAFGSADFFFLQRTRLQNFFGISILRGYSFRSQATPCPARQVSSLSCKHANSDLEQKAETCIFVWPDKHRALRFLF